MIRFCFIVIAHGAGTQGDETQSAHLHLLLLAHLIRQQREVEPDRNSGHLYECLRRSQSSSPLFWSQIFSSCSTLRCPLSASLRGRRSSTEQQLRDSDSEAAGRFL